MFAHIRKDLNIWYKTLNGNNGLVEGESGEGEGRLSIGLFGLFDYLNSVVACRVHGAFDGQIASNWNVDRHVVWFVIVECRFCQFE